MSNTPDFLPVLANTFDRNSKKNFLNEYYDDEGWWALGWAGAYELTHEARYLEMAELIFADMAGGWDDTICGGGIWWKKPKQYKNAIANELFLSVAAKLASLTPDAQKRATYLDWAQREWKWFAASGMINSENLVNDGLDAACHNNHRTTWTYNQGVILGGLTVLAKVIRRCQAPGGRAVHRVGGNLAANGPGWRTSRSLRACTLWKRCTAVQRNFLA